jgi:hypothetical protein
MEDYGYADQSYGNGSCLFKTGDIFIFGTVLKKDAVKTLGVQTQYGRIDDEKHKGRYAEPEKEHGKRMAKEEQDEKIYQYRGDSGKDYKSYKCRLFIYHFLP